MWQAEGSEYASLDITRGFIQQVVDSNIDTLQTDGYCIHVETGTCCVIQQPPALPNLLSNKHVCCAKSCNQEPIDIDCYESIMLQMQEHLSF